MAQPVALARISERGSVGALPCAVSERIAVSDDVLLDDLRNIRLSLTPGTRMLISQIPPLRKQLLVLRAVEAEIIRLRKITEKIPSVRAVRF